MGQCPGCRAGRGTTHCTVRLIAQSGATRGEDDGIVAVSPAVGTPTGRHDTVTVDLAELDPSDPAAFRPCEWVSDTGARGMLGGQVTLEPYGDQTGSVDMACIYNKPGDMGDRPLREQTQTRTARG